jgi:phage/plasmid-associated DNA primase
MYDYEIAEIILNNINKNGFQCVYDEGTLYLWDGKKWTEISDDAFFKEYIRLVPVHVNLTTKKIKSITRWVKSIVNKPDFFDDRIDGINCQNGLVCFDDATGKPRLIPHSPSHKKRAVLKGDWVPFTGIPSGSLLEKFLSGIFKDNAKEKLMILQELVGAALLEISTRIRHPKAFIIYGSGENGKSEFIKIIEQLSVSVSHTFIFNIPNKVIKLRGKTLNTLERIDSNIIKRDIFKSVILGKSIKGKVFHKALFAFQPIALHIFETNSLPDFKRFKINKRIFRILEFDRKIPQEEQIADIGSKIVESEYETLLGWAVEGASRLIRNKTYTRIFYLHSNVLNSERYLPSD